MNSENTNTLSNLEPFEDRIDILFRELELAVNWGRPSILLAVYGSDYIRSDAVHALKNRLSSIGQDTVHLNIRSAEHFDIPAHFAAPELWEKSIYFVSGLGSVSSNSRANAYTSLSRGREFFIDNKIRIVIWLTEDEAINLAHCAPDYWAYRHRVIEFTESPKPEQILSRALEFAWQGIGEYTDSLEDTDAQIILREAMLADLPDQDEVTAIRANLLLTLGILHWRKGEFEKADKFLQTAFQAAAKMEDNWFKAECSNAIALVKSDLGMAEEAIDAYKYAIRLAPDQIFPWNNLGNLYIKLDRFNDAFSAFEKAIEHNPCDSVSWNGLGNLYQKLKREDDAIAAYHKAIEYSSDFASPWNGIGSVLYETGQFEDAIRVYQKAIEVNNQFAVAWIGLGDVFKQQNRNGNAALAYEKALEIDPKNALVWHELGRIFYRLGKLDEANQAYKNSTQLNPASGWLCGDLGQLYARLDQHQNAITLYLKSLELLTAPEDQAVMWNRLGSVYRQINEYEKAISAYQTADELDGGESVFDENWLDMEPIDDSQALVDDEFSDWLNGLTADYNEENCEPAESIRLGEHVEEDNYASDETSELKQEAAPAGSTGPIAGSGLAMGMQVVEQETMLAELEPSQAEGAEEMVWTVAEEETTEQQGAEADDDEAEASGESPAEEAESVQASAEIDPEGLPYRGAADQMEAETDSKNAHIWNELGNIYFTTGAYEQAVKAYKNAIQLDGRYGWPYGNLGLTYAHQGQYEEAIPLYQQSLELLSSEKDQAVMWNRLGNAYRRLNDYENAAKAYRMADGLGPNQISLLTRARFSLLSNCHVD